MIKINLIVDPAGGRMAILKEQKDNVKIYTYKGNYKIDMFQRNIRMIDYLQNIIDETRKLENADSKEIVEISIYLEKPRIAQFFNGRVVEKGYGYRIHWVISTILTVYCLAPNVNIKKVCLISVNKWYYSLGLNKGGRKMRKQNAIDFAEDIIKEYNIELKELKEDEADCVGIWYYVKEVCDYEILGKTDTKTAAMNIGSKKIIKKDIELKKKVIDWFSH